LLSSVSRKNKLLRQKKRKKRKQETIITTVEKNNNFSKTFKNAADKIIKQYYYGRKFKDMD